MRKITQCKLNYLQIIRANISNNSIHAYSVITGFLMSDPSVNHFIAEPDLPSTLELFICLIRIDCSLRFYLFVEKYCGYEMIFDTCFSCRKTIIINKCRQLLFGPHE